MLAYYPPPHDTSMQSLHYHQHPSSTTSQPFDHFDATTSTVHLPSYFPVFDGFADHDMPQVATQQQPQNPPIRVQQSSPPATSRVARNKMMRTQSNINTGALRHNQGAGLLSPVHLSQSHPHTNGGHKRASLGSSVTSATPTSPLDHTRSYPQVANSDPYSSPSATEYMDTYSAPHSNYPKSLPTPLDTPVSNSFFDIHHNYQPTAHDVGLSDVQMAMRRSMFEQAPADDDAGSYQHSVAQSVSSMSHNSPKTPLTAFPDEFDDGSKGMQPGENRISDVDKWMDEYLRLDDTPDYNFQVPMSRSMSSMHDDLLMDSPSPTSAPQQKSRQSIGKSGGLLDTHYRTVFNDRLQLVQQSHATARSQSPSTSTISGEQSPFRQGSPYAAQPPQSYAPQRSPQSRMTASQLRQHHKAGEDAMEMAQHQQGSEETPKTISPKDAVYEYHQTPEEAAMPLFPQEQHVPQYNSQYSTPLTLQQSPMTSQAEQSYGGLPTARRESSSFSGSNYAYIPSQAAGAQGYSFANPLMRQESSMPNTSDRTPDFPAHLRSMESSVSEMTTTSIELPQRPVDTSSDAGTYSCTYHGCPQRFETPSKLQKHKREAHRQTTPSGMTAAIASRNSQAGPHKCTRVNPSTGKPCNSEFSRPYDLTRHEDTIHNARKMKVRCHLCQEEKTFSRNDALTRHMRVVHPEIDWPGKTRRKNARD
jgi:hypothetical protein